MALDRWEGGRYALPPPGLAASPTSGIAARSPASQTSAMRAPTRVTESEEVATTG